MCGICGVWEYSSAVGNIDVALMKRMSDEMRHRGPDDAGELIFDGGRGGFGFRRLSIIDLSEAGHQPMHGCTDNLWLVFNGEIYNHALLREDLKKRGHTYASRTNSETILHLYEERGLDFVNDIEVDYAIALWGGKRHQLALVRERIGVKPHYFYYQNGRLIFASEIKAILQHPGVTPDIDEKALYHYLTFLTTPAPNTLFRDIRKLPAGHMLTAGRDARLNLKRDWDPLPAECANPRSDEDHKAESLRMLRDSI